MGNSCNPKSKKQESNITLLELERESKTEKRAIQSQTLDLDDTYQKNEDSIKSIKVLVQEQKPEEKHEREVEKHEKVKRHEEDQKQDDKHEQEKVS